MTDQFFSDEPLDVRSIVNSVRNNKAGAVVVFEGVTRDNTVAPHVRALEYEAHETLAKKQLSALMRDAATKWNLCDVCVVHRIGEVPVGQAGVVIATSAPHRKDAFEANEYLIDELKRTVAIWKKEIYVDGTSKWISPAQSCV